MNRRSFLRSLLGLVAAPIASAIPALEPYYIAISHPSGAGYGFVSWKVYEKVAILNDGWIGQVENFRDLGSVDLGTLSNI